MIISQLYHLHSTGSGNELEVSLIRYIVLRHAFLRGRPAGHVCLVGRFQPIHGHVKSLWRNSKRDTHPAFEVRRHMIVNRREEQDAGVLIEGYRRPLIFPRLAVRRQPGKYKRRCFAWKVLDRVRL